MTSLRTVFLSVLVVNLFFCWGVSPSLSASKKKSRTKTVEPKVDTVVVYKTIPESAKRKKAKVKLGDHNNNWGVGVTTGYYALDGISNNWHSEASYDYFIESNRFFFEAIVGAGPAWTASKMDVGGRPFDKNLFLTYGVQTVVMVGKAAILDFSNPFNFLSLGFTGAYLGGDNAIGVSVGFGTRFPFKSNKSSNLAWRWEVKDQIYTRRISLDTRVTHNIYLGIGVQFGSFGL